MLHLYDAEIGAKQMSGGVERNSYQVACANHTGDLYQLTLVITTKISSSLIGVCSLAGSEGQLKHLGHPAFSGYLLHASHQ